MPIPDSLMSRAYVSPGADEYAWRLDEIESVVTELAASRNAIRGAEIWLVPDIHGGWIGELPLQDTSIAPTGFCSWSNGPRLYGMESWAQFCSRLAQETLDYLAALRPEELFRREVQPFLWVNLTIDEELLLD
jgi:hypothetical protein